MGFFNKTNNAEEYKKIDNFLNYIDNLLNMDSYISKKQYLTQYNEVKEMYDKIKYMENENILVAWCKQKKINVKDLNYLVNKYVSVENSIDKHNVLYVEKHLKEDESYLDTILCEDDPNINLDIDQRKVVLSDEDYTLVIAGAGAGKTTTIEAKVKYLVDKKSIEPARILIVSFTRKATQELKERFHRLNIPVNISTFHSIGYTIIKNNDYQMRKIVDSGFMYKVIEDYLINKLDDEYFIKKIILFFASYLNMPFEADDISLLFKTLSANDVTTLKNDLALLLDNYNQEQTKQRITINNEKVRSIDECRIANFLFINGIDYEYEPVYRYGFENSTKPYCPDFLIKQGDKVIYLEHFGISENGNNNRFSKEELNLYKKNINDKILLHKKHNTKLIYTFSKYNDGRDIIYHLKQILINEGIKFNSKEDIEIYKQLKQKAEDKYFNKLIMLVCNFIHRFKVNNYNLDTKFDDWFYTIKNERTKLFLEIVKICFNVYEQKRLDANAIDFEDMINDASNILDKKIKEKELLPYDYIFVDEYQDISLQRFDLCEKLAKASCAKIIAVGDDWQSIFRFTGAQIDLFTKYKQKMGYANILKITKTYRNSQELIDIAGGFVMENQKQIKKDLKSNKSISDPVILMSYDDSYEKDDKKHGPFYRLGEAIERSLDDIVAKCGMDKNVLLIGRYNFDGKNLSKLEDFFCWDGYKLRSKKYPEINISFLTAHASKGLGSDNVIIINGKDDMLGFPSKIEDDPVMKLVINDKEELDYEEERRLFYVALTRTKNRVYIITPQFRPSKFILEIQNKFTQVILRGVDLFPICESTYKYSCPICGYPLQKRHSNLKFLTPTQKLWICSNDPELCGFMTNDLNGNKDRLSISKCPNCVDGYLVVKSINSKDGKSSRMLGCTNYKKDGSGCNISVFGDNFTQNKKEMIVSSSGKIFKSELILDAITILDSLNSIYSRYSNFKFGFVLLQKFLKGEESRPIVAFKLNNDKNFGALKNKDNNQIKRLINTLITLDVISKDKDDRGYDVLILKQKELSDSQMYILDHLI